MRRSWTLVLAAILTPIPGLAQQVDRLQQAVETITEADVARRLGVIAADSMGGRNTPSEGLELTAEYIAAEFQRLGLEPGGDDGSFVQSYPLQHIELDPSRSDVEFSGGPTLSFGSDVAFSLGRLGPDSMSGALTIIRGALPSDEELAELNLAESIVMTPSDLDPAARARIVRLYRLRPSALLVVGDFNEGVWNYLNNRPPPARLIVPGQEGAGRAVFFVQAEKLKPFLSRHGIALSESGAEATAFEVLRPEGLQVTIRQARVKRSEHRAPNVVGILPGSDPELRDEYIVFSAHMDHIGTAGEPFSSCRPQGEDRICNGADDDGSGTVAILELAEAFAALQPRPRRSLIFLTVSGEEKGLLGSRYFAENPAVEIGSIVANINADMIGRNWSDTIVVIGRQHSDLGSRLDRVAAEHPELRMTPTEDPWPEERFYFRSDHINFARRGVPILFFFSGTHPDYHQAGDEVDKIDIDKTARVIRLVFHLGLQVANDPSRPLWDPDSYETIVEGARSQ